MQKYFERKKVAESREIDRLDGVGLVQENIKVFMQQDINLFL